MAFKQKGVCWKKGLMKYPSINLNPISKLLRIKFEEEKKMKHVPLLWFSPEIPKIYSRTPIVVPKNDKGLTIAHGNSQNELNTIPVEGILNERLESVGGLDCGVKFLSSATQAYRLERPFCIVRQARLG